MRQILGVVKLNNSMCEGNAALLTSGSVKARGSGSGALKPGAISNPLITGHFYLAATGKRPSAAPHSPARCVDQAARAWCGNTQKPLARGPSLSSGINIALLFLLF